VAEAPVRTPVLKLEGPLTVKEVEDVVFRAARGDPHFEAAQRTWMEADRSYFIRWRAIDADPLQVIGLIHAYQLPEMASRVEAVPFDTSADQAPLATYVALLRAELTAQGFA
jgi:hypothetical protein